MPENVMDMMKPSELDKMSCMSEQQNIHLERLMPKDVSYRMWSSSESQKCQDGVLI